MKSARQISIGLLLILLFGCSGSDEQAVEVGNETGPLENQELATIRAGNDDKLSAGNQTGQPRRKSAEVSEPEQLPKKDALDTGTKVARKTGRTKPPRRNEKHSPPRNREPIAKQAQEKSPAPPVEPVKEPVAERVPAVSGPVEEVEVVETRAAGNLDASKTQTVAIPPSPPRRSPTGSPGPVVVSSRAGKTDLKTATLPAGTVIEVRTAERISSKDNVSGDSFEATLIENLTADGEVVFGRGGEVKGRLLEVVRPGKVKGRGSITFNLQEIRWNENIYALETNSITLEAESSKGKDAATVGAATAIGAVLGAVFGGKKGAAVGSATAGGAGAARVLLSRGKDVEVPAERLFSFRLEKDIEVRSH